MKQKVIRFPGEALAAQAKYRLYCGLQATGLTMQMCMQVLKPVAAATSKVRALKGLSLKESVSQFSSTMTAQADLRVECAHLRRFYNNFASVSQSVTPPYPFPGFETAEVLVETFEPGELLHCHWSIHSCSLSAFYPSIALCSVSRVTQPSQIPGGEFPKCRGGALAPLLLH